MDTTSTTHILLQAYLLVGVAKLILAASSVPTISWAVSRTVCGKGQPQRTMWRYMAVYVFWMAVSCLLLWPTVLLSEGRYFFLAPTTRELLRNFIVEYSEYEYDEHH